MGVTMYWLIIAVTVILGQVMPQHGRKRIRYIAVMALIHAFVSGFRYMYLTGDLMKYQWNYVDYLNHDYFSEHLLQEGINTGFLWFCKLISTWSDGDFQVFLVVVAVIIEAALAMIVYKYSPIPWISFLVWNCMGFYIFGFSALKQSLAMAIVMLAMVAVLENRCGTFVVLTLIAGFIHFPAYAFFPAYWIAKARIRPLTIICYVAAALLIFTFQTPIVEYITDIYYEEGELILSDSAALGGRFFMMVVILVMGICLKGFGDRRFEKLFNIMVVAAVFQMFCRYDNIFTRFADYYFQMSVLFLPLMVSSLATDPRLGGSHQRAIFRFNKRSLEFIAICMAVYLIWYYNKTCLSTTISNEVDNFLNYRSMWDVR